METEEKNEWLEDMGKCGGRLRGAKGNYHCLCARHGSHFGERKTRENSVCLFLINVMAKIYKHLNNRICLQLFQ